MISLLLDTSNFKLVVAVVDEDKNEVLSYYNEKLNSDLSVKVFEVIKQCIDNANIIPNDIDKIYSITGPGSFTGVRIGVTICKTFAWTLNKKVIPISSLELLASTNTNYELNVAMIDARRDCVYAGVYDNELNTVIEDRYISIEQLLLELDNQGICTSTGSACSSGSSEPSHVLTAIGCPKEYIQGSLRVTFGEENTKEDVEYLVKNILEITKKLNK